MTDDPGPSGARHLSGSVVAAAILLAVKAALGIWASAVLFAASSIHHRRLLGAVVRQRHAGLGLVLLVFVLATVAVIIGLVTLQRWARSGAFVLEGAAVVLSLTRIGSRPGLALVSVSFSVVVLGLLLVRGSADAFR